MDSVKVRDKEFELFLAQKTIEDAIEKVAKQMTKDLDGRDPLFVCILNGSFMFASELMKRVNIPSEISFVKLSSYSGTATTGEVKEVYGLNKDIAGRTVVVVEDIVDTGYTMEKIIAMLGKSNPADIRVATLLLKPEALKVEVKLDYVAMEIPNDFIVGYGLDYDGHGRNLPNIYKIKN